MSTSQHSKPCTICNTPRDILVRCQIDDSAKWYFVCPGKCWRSVSGGEIDAKGHRDEFPYYRYGGMWKNRHADGPLNAKKPKRKREKNKSQDIGKEAQAGDDGTLVSHMPTSRLDEHIDDTASEHLTDEGDPDAPSRHGDVRAELSGEA